MDTNLILPAFFCEICGTVMKLDKINDYGRFVSDSRDKFDILTGEKKLADRVAHFKCPKMFIAGHCTIEYNLTTKKVYSNYEARG